PAKSSLRIGIFGAEPWTNAMRAEIEQAFDMDAVDIYGLSEVIGPGVANECVETKDGPHIWEDHFYPGIINPETGAVLPDARPGADDAARSACDRDLAHHIKSLIGVTAAVETMPPGAIERSVGKAKRIIDLRPKG